MKKYNMHHNKDVYNTSKQPEIENFYHTVERNFNLDRNKIESSSYGYRPISKKYEPPLKEFPVRTIFDSQIYLPNTENFNRYLPNKMGIYRERMKCILERYFENPENIKRFKRIELRLIHEFYKSMGETKKHLHLSIFFTSTRMFKNFLEKHTHMDIEEFLQRRLITLFLFIVLGLDVKKAHIIYGKDLSFDPTLSSKYDYFRQLVYIKINYKNRQGSETQTEDYNIRNTQEFFTTIRRLLLGEKPQDVRFNDLKVAIKFIETMSEFEKEIIVKFLRY